MFNPVSTYRIQFHHQFTFKDFDQLIPYLQALGIQTIYASPVLEAVPGSMHGYDTINPHRINPEIGTIEELRAIAGKLKKAGMQWIQDIVPNHMAFHPGNSWLMDVLEKGKSSAYAGFFDINWSGLPDEPLMVPFLGTTLQEAIDRGELKLTALQGKLFLKYQETVWPVNAAVKDINMPLKEAIACQYYRLCHWAETNQKINFRRFFTVNNLICLNIQHKETFTAYHQLIKTLLDEGVFQGLRVDHIDGLYHPDGYLEELRKLAGEDIYIVVEKILGKSEDLAGCWPVQGNTGYDFLALSNNLFTYKKARKYFSKYYKQIAGQQKPVSQQIRDKKLFILTRYMAGELDNLYHLFLELELAPKQEIEKLKEGTLKLAIAELLVDCPVYRFYGQDFPLSGKDLDSLKKLIKGVAKRKNLQEAAALIGNVLTGQAHLPASANHNSAEIFYRRLMQFSGPLMAKGVEDTLMYTYHRFITHNEVGDSPGSFGISKKVIHNQMWKRQKDWPLSLNASATHDTKRGEDFRARLNVLSALPNEWIQNVKEWKRQNSELSYGVNADDEYFIYQTLIGSYPMPGTPEADYPERLCAYLSKALREGKVHSDWAAPDESYEQLIKDFALNLLHPAGSFLENFAGLHRKVADFGILDSLSQLLLKFISPGVPDTYQGTELWDFSLVDPDNRRPVAYKQREKWLQELVDSESSLSTLWSERYTGKIKLLLLHQLMLLRKSVPELFTEGEYVPLKVKGKYASHIFAFARKQEQHWLITVIPLHLPLLMEQVEEVFDTDWDNTRVILPAHAPLKWKNLLTGEKGSAEGLALPVAEIFKEFPLGLLQMEQKKNERAAGVLLHITSLPAAHGIGDLGPEAIRFADFLARAGQKYWQLLPLNPIGAEQAFSPYSSVSGMAGNTLLISLELLQQDGLLKEKEIKDNWQYAAHTVNFESVSALKTKLLHQAFDRFTTLSDPLMKEQFAAFCKKEESWLDDFALYSVLKSVQESKPWYHWQKAYKLREPAALEKFAAQNHEQLVRVKWNQFIFFKQWAALKSYVNAAGIQFYGDLPFYVGHDSADVWANTELFNLKPDGELKGVAGVPPDYFNEDGQLWGMPVYAWDKLKKTGYQWWLARIHKNMELYDLLRLDHFRAFAAYWEVESGAENAVKGTWKTGPGADFFTVLKNEFPHLPFVAEDLGEITPDVYALRDEFKLMGMKVLQFAFGEDTDVSEHIPYRFQSPDFVVYTGTHDNDTTVGWYMQEAGKTERKNLNRYAGKSINKTNVHQFLAQTGYNSVAKIVILPMQDILGMDGKSRMNKPASIERNWEWGLKKQPGKEVEKKLRKLAEVYGRL